MLIAVSGYARAGKDTFANILMGAYEFERAAFADNLRSALYNLNPYVGPWTDLKSIVDEHGWEYAKTQGPKSQHEEVRRLLQAMGTEVGRTLFGENFWVDTLLNNLDVDKHYVISDCRFQNEADAIREFGGYVVRVERPGTGPVNGHPSETALDDYDFDMVFANDSGLEDFAYQITEWMEEISSAY